MDNSNHRKHDNGKPARAALSFVLSLSCVFSPSQPPGRLHSSLFPRWRNYASKEAAWPQNEIRR